MTVKYYISTVLSQQCYLQANCTSGASFAVSSAEECCVGTDNGMSYADENGTCIISECIGKLAWESVLCVLIPHSATVILGKLKKMPIFILLHNFFFSSNGLPCNWH